MTMMSYLHWQISLRVPFKYIEWDRDTFYPSEFFHPYIGQCATGIAHQLHTCGTYKSRVWHRCVETDVQLVCHMCKLEHVWHTCAYTPVADQFNTLVCHTHWLHTCGTHCHRNRVTPVAHTKVR